MHLERVLQIGIAALVALSTFLLGLGEQEATLPLAAVIIAFASVYVTDVQGWIRLGPRMADGLGLLAGLLALVQWQREVSDAGLLALLNFAIYAQFVLQFKRKNIGTYWLLVALSLVEAAVATALNESMSFGFLLLLYVALAIGVLTVFYLYREQVRSQARSNAEQRSVPSGNRPPEVDQFAPVERQAPFAGHLIAQQADQAVNLPLARLVGNVGGIVLGLACALFVVIPRAERGVWREVDADQTQRVVGFSNEVQLGEMGAISESAEEIMEVHLEDPTTGQPCELIDEPLFRGVLLTSYANRKWKQELFHGTTLDATPPPPGAPIIKQRIVIRPLDTDVLFSLYPAYAPFRRPEILWDRDGEQLKRSERLRETSLEYELVTTAIADRRLSSIVQAPEVLDDYARSRLLALPAPRNGADPLAGTRATAARIVRDIPPENHLERARVLTNFLRDPTNFRYSLGEVRRDPAIDPVEDFVMQNRVGHCEYFASALAVMLRTVDIPSRLAIGFKGGDWTGRYYQVCALDAHAWVEVYLSPKNLPANLPAGMDREKGGWLVVDPTVGVGESPALNAGSYVLEGFKQFLATLRTGWRNYILGLNHSRQQESIYVPLRNGIVAGLVSLTERDTWRMLARRAAKAVSPTYWGLTNGGWFSWRGALAAMVMMLGTLASYYAGMRLLRRYRRSARQAAVAQRGAAEVEFYRRLEALLAERELCRTPSQTQREFALAVGGQLAESPHTKHAAPVARQLVELFYRVRFGRRTLDSQEAAAVEQALSELAGALAPAADETHRKNDEDRFDRLPGIGQEHVVRMVDRHRSRSR